MKLFDEEVKFDFGANIAFKSGLVLQEKFDWLAKVPKESIQYKSHTMELYYEVINFNLFLQKLNTMDNIVSK